MPAQALKCKECSTTYPLEARYVCERCFGPLEWIGGGAFLALQGFCRHLFAVLSPAWVLRRERRRGEALHRISQALLLEPDGIATVSGRAYDRMVGGASLGQSLHPS